MSRGRDAKSLSTTRSSAEQVRISRPGPKLKGVARTTTLSSKGAKGDVDSHAAAGSQKKNAPPQGEIPGIWYTPFESGKQFADDLLLAAEPSEDSEIDVTSHSRLTPSLDGDSADHAGTPAAPVAETLQTDGGFQQVDHLSLASHFCISTIPEDSRGGMVRTA